jgi:protein-tyrosine phosphatase
MIDMHIHVLPGVDDGIKNSEDAVECCRLAAADGTSEIIVTPHMKEGFYLNERSRVLAAAAELQERLDREGVVLRVLPGSEVYFAPDLVSGVRDGRLATLADGGRYLLLELPYTQHPVGVDETIFNLKVAGITPIMAHPERIRWFQEDLGRLDRAIRLGALSQLTTTSLTGGFGSKVEEIALEMVRRRMVHFLASDSHDRQYRPPRLSAAVARLTALAGEETARRAVQDHPLAVIRGEPIDPPDPIDAGGGGGDRPSALSRFWRRLIPKS